VVNHAVRAVPAILCLAVAPLARAQAPASGAIRGTVTDKEFGSPIEIATVNILGTKTRVSTSANGSFLIPNVPDGTYTLIITKSGYVREVRPNVTITGGRLVEADVQMAGEFEDMEEFVVQDMELGPEVVDTQAVMPLPDLEPVVVTLPLDFSIRLDSPQLLDVLGVETISRSGASDAAAALLLVPGASLQDGKYAVVRGLPDRYVSVLLDGVRLPVSVPDKRAVQLDQFPTAVIDRIEVSKSFTPDQQGEASGGAVNVVLKDIPDEAVLQLRYQMGFNSQVKNGEFLTYPGGGLGFWGQNDTQKLRPDLAGQSWPNPTGTTTGDAPLIYKWSAAGGDSWEVDDGVKIGAFGNFFYDQGASFFDNGQLNSLVQTAPGAALSPEQLGVGDFTTELFDVTQGTQSIQWGGMGSAGIETEEHKVGGKFIYTLLSEDQAVRLIDTRGKQFFFPGYDPNDPTSPGVDRPNEAPYNRLETLDYSQVSTQAFILNGEHTLGFLGPGEDDEIPSPIGLGAPTVDWRLSLSRAEEEQPDQTQFSAKWQATQEIVFPPFVFTEPSRWTAYPPAQDTNVGWVQHIFYQTIEDSTQFAFNGKLPFLQWNDREGYVKFGAFVDSVSRSYRQDTWQNNGDPNSQYQDPPVTPVPFTEPWSAVFPSQVHPINQSQFDISYNGSQSITAGYGMIDLPFNETMNLVTGLRYEGTEMSTSVIPDDQAVWINPLDPAAGYIAVKDPATGQINPAVNAGFTENLFLPMVGLNWNITDQLVLRGSYAETLARPNFFELVPVLQYQYIGGPVFIGNPALEMSSINNYDARIDWTPNTDWLISASLFYKTISKPIQYQQQFTSGFSYTTALNYDTASLLGVELESRVTLDPILGEAFEGLACGFNFTYMESSVTLPADQAAELAPFGGGSSIPMTATPNYLFNTNVTYDFRPTGTQLGVFYNLQGDSLISAASISSQPTGTALVPDLYQIGYGTLNFTASQEIIQGLRFNFAAKNLANPDRQTQYRSFDGNDGLNSTYTTGVDFTFALSYTLFF
jgi:outer membrane receptor protein involved in Fe transport